MWDDLASSNAAIVLPDEVIAEAQRRRAELLAVPEIAIDDEDTIDGDCVYFVSLVIGSSDRSRWFDRVR
ncbi:MAG: hypothetical protein NTV29_10810 [Planctomycetota bacterium]|nr:hypothetical protein [Planctomycetota bacterium]